MKKIILSSLFFGSLLLASSIKTQIPMSASLLSVENSGTLNAIDAYQDGIGIYTVEQIGGTMIDNSEMNSLVYKYGAEAKITNVSIKDYINSNGNSSEKILANKLGKFEPIKLANGIVCNDNNAQTINDKYVNGVCVGNIPSSCKELFESGNTTTANYTLKDVGEAYCENGYTKLLVSKLLVSNIQFNSIVGYSTEKVNRIKGFIGNLSGYKYKINLGSYMIQDHQASYSKDNYYKLPFDVSTEYPTTIKVSAAMVTWMGSADTIRLYVDNVGTIPIDTGSNHFQDFYYGSSGSGVNYNYTPVSYTSIKTDNSSIRVLATCTKKTAGGWCNGLIDTLLVETNYDLPSITEYVIVN